MRGDPNVGDTRRSGGAVLVAPRPHRLRSWRRAQRAGGACQPPATAESDASSNAWSHGGRQSQRRSAVSRPRDGGRMGSCQRDLGRAPSPKTGGIAERAWTRAGRASGGAQVRQEGCGGTRVNPAAVCAARGRYDAFPNGKQKRTLQTRQRPRSAKMRGDLVARHGTGTGLSLHKGGTRKICKRRTTAEAANRDD